MCGSLKRLEDIGGEPDIIDYDDYGVLFGVTSKETPIGETHKIISYNQAVRLADSWGVSLMSEKQYRHLQTLGEFDTTNMTWLQNLDGRSFRAMIGRRNAGQVEIKPPADIPENTNLGFRSVIWVQLAYDDHV